MQVFLQPLESEVQHTQDLGGKALQREPRDLCFSSGSAASWITEKNQLFSHAVFCCAVIIASSNCAS